MSETVEINDSVEIPGRFGESVLIEPRAGYVSVIVEEGEYAAGACLSIAAATRLRDALTTALVVAAREPSDAE